MIKIFSKQNTLQYQHIYLLAIIKELTMWKCDVGCFISVYVESRFKHYTKAFCKDIFNAGQNSSKLVMSGTYLSVQ